MTFGECLRRKLEELNEIVRTTSDMEKGHAANQQAIELEKILHEVEQVEKKYEEPR